MRNDRKNRQPKHMPIGQPDLVEIMQRLHAGVFPNKDTTWSELLEVAAGVLACASTEESIACYTEFLDIVVDEACARAPHLPRGAFTLAVGKEIERRAGRIKEACLLKKSLPK